MGSDERLHAYVAPVSIEEKSTHKKAAEIKSPSPFYAVDLLLPVILQCLSIFQSVTKTMLSIMRSCFVFIGNFTESDHKQYASDLVVCDISAVQSNRCLII